MDAFVRVCAVLLVAGVMGAVVFSGSISRAMSGVSVFAGQADATAIAQPADQHTSASRNTSGALQRDRINSVAVRTPTCQPLSDDEYIAQVARDLPSPGRRPLRVIRSGVFVVISECDTTWTRQRVWLFERTYAQYAAFATRLGVRLTEPTELLVCVLLSDADRYTEYSRACGDNIATWAAGYYSTRKNRIVFYDDRQSPHMRKAIRTLDTHEKTTRDAISSARRSGRLDEKKASQALATIRDERRRITRENESNATRKAIHECVHLLAFNTGLQRQDRVPPVWLSEGLATSFETDQPKTAFGPGLGVQRVSPVRFGISMPHAVVLTDPHEIPSSAATGFYEMSLDLFESLYRTRRDELRGYFQDIASLPAGKPSTETLGAIFEARFGTPVSLAQQLGW